VTLSPMAIRQLRKLLGLLDIHLTSAIESNEVPGVALTGQEPEVRQDFRDRLRAREWRKILLGNLPKSSPGRARSGRTKPRKADGGESKSTKTHQANP
jgi:hypothetical protein